MTKNNKAPDNKEQEAPKAPVVQQFASGASAVPTPQPPYDVERVHGSSVKPAQKPQSSGPDQHKNKDPA